MCELLQRGARRVAGAHVSTCLSTCTYGRCLSAVVEAERGLWYWLRHRQLAAWVLETGVSREAYGLQSGSMCVWGWGVLGWTDEWCCKRG